MSGSRRPSVTIYDYPEHLNPFNDDTSNSHPQIHRDAKSSAAKEGKHHKFWTFGRSRKKRSNSFSIKSTWTGLFGKRKESADSQEKRSTITTVSSTYKRQQPFDKPVVPPRVSRDQQEFDEALGTLARRRKYTLDNTSRYSSCLTVNGDPSRIYDGSPQDTTVSIMGDLTPKPPVRRFGQVSPRPTDKIPSFDYDEKEHKENGSVTLRDKGFERMPVPPMRRSGTRLSHRLNNSTLDSEEETGRTGDVTLRDENENVPEDYIFKRFNQDAVRKSNLSINSCVSIGSTVSAYGRKKRRAPQPPRCKEQLETPQENDVHQRTTEVPGVELQITESIDIARVTENIDEMTKKSNELIDASKKETDTSVDSVSEMSDKRANEESNDENVDREKEDSRSESVDRLDDDGVRSVEKESTRVAKEEQQYPNDATVEISSSDVTENESTETMDKRELELPEKTTKSEEQVEQVELEDLAKEEDGVSVEYRRKSSPEDKLEIFKEIGELDSSDEGGLPKKGSSGNLSRHDSFSVKEEIEKIERQIKALELQSGSPTESTCENEAEDAASNARLSIQANRRHFFQNMVDADKGKDGIKIEYKELPREQNIHVVKLTDPPVPVSASTVPVKVIELHISEPIKQKAELLDEVNPIPKPRRHSALNLNCPEPCAAPRGERGTSELLDKKGKSF